MQTNTRSPTKQISGACKKTRGQWPFRPAVTWAMESLTTGIWAGGKVSLSWSKWEPALPGLYLFICWDSSLKIMLNPVQNGLPTLQILFYLVLSSLESNLVKNAFGSVWSCFFYLGFLKSSFLNEVFYSTVS